jgi:hypothetical protein
LCCVSVELKVFLKCCQFVVIVDAEVRITVISTYLVSIMSSRLCDVTFIRLYVQLVDAGRIVLGCDAVFIGNVTIRRSLLTTSLWSTLKTEAVKSFEKPGTNYQ